MKRQSILLGYLMVGIGIYFLLRQLQIPIVTNFYSWPTLLIIIGLIFLIYSYKVKDFSLLFPGTLLFGLGIHFHGIAHYSFWINHWGVYPLIIGIAFFVQYLKTKKGLLPSLILIGLSIFIIYSVQLPSSLSWIYSIFNLLERFWPIAVIILGIYFIKSKK